MKSSLRKLLMAAPLGLVVLSGLTAHQASAAVQLGFIIDESGSISASEFGIIRTGLANAINTLVPTDSSYEISVVKFDNDAEVVVNKVLINNVATRTNVANAILAMSQEGGTTNYAAAFNLMSATLNASANNGASYVNFATDGEPNEPGNGNQPENAAVTARNALIAGGVDNISIEGIGVSGGAANFLQNSICFPGPCDATAPYNFPTQGFYIGVANATGYANAIGNKIQTITQVPEPMSLALFGVGLAGLGMVSRRKRAA